MVTTYQLLNVTWEEKQKSQKQKQTYMQEKKMKQLNSVSRLTPEVFSYQSLTKLEKCIYSQTYVHHCVFSEFCF